MLPGGKDLYSFAAGLKEAWRGGQRAAGAVAGMGGQSALHTIMPAKKLNIFDDRADIPRVGLDN
jgi:hypothetical protein